MDSGDESGQPRRRRVVEPTRVISSRRSSRLEDLELFRPEPAAGDPSGAPAGVPADDPPTEQLPGSPLPGTGTGSAAGFGASGNSPGPGSTTGATGTPGHPRTRVLPGMFPPSPGAAPGLRGLFAGRRPSTRTAGFLAAGAGAAVLVVLLLTRGGAETTAPGTAAPPAPSAAPAEPTAIPQPPTEAEPEGGGVLQPGDSGPAVSELQDRLSRIPNVYTERGADGQYDDVLTEAVARFQLWYGIRGDEEGVYGDDTRRDLESRT
ncbi:peptidoglycan-binding protein [Streptomyces sp. WAC 00631]|uniref:peptidoglycan-binding protein n=1 Tax=Streptomyces sp. WAC 00631 TaxID=2203201 RepID=UPI001E4E3242|nr:peptidoglycan-binding protein [Streptomyces sp. WAC 00631]MCC5036228.1 peptidoglycan-binding protein [Streptomyces sp. WAC 00631]